MVAKSELRVKLEFVIEVQSLFVYSLALKAAVKIEDPAKIRVRPRVRAAGSDKVKFAVGVGVTFGAQPSQT